MEIYLTNHFLSRQIEEDEEFLLTLDFGESWISQKSLDDKEKKSRGQRASEKNSIALPERYLLWLLTTRSEVRALLLAPKMLAQILVNTPEGLSVPKFKGENESSHVLS